MKITDTIVSYISASTPSKIVRQLYKNGIAIVFINEGDYATSKAKETTKAKEAWFNQETKNMA